VVVARLPSQTVPPRRVFVDAGAGSWFRVRRVIAYRLMPPIDTTDRAHAIQTAIHRSQSAAAKFKAALEMSDFTHKLAEVGLRQRVPGCAESDIPRLLAEILYGRRNKRS
jgi:hypothetical protein